ncbi:MAG: cyclic nucleotide-binding domain-containing protein [Deltaproteobacteria bacterium]|nr:cyclic nucleotide-binding domain-containing protein [Deltaproteobacteria bacterium]
MGKFTTLDKASLTQTWSLEERSALAHFMEKKEVKTGDPLFVARSKERGLFIVDSGLVRLNYENLSQQLKPGDSFGELSLIYPTQKLASADALQNSELIFLSFENWTTMRKVAPLVSLKLMESICAKFAQQLNEMIPPPKLFS